MIVAHCVGVPDFIDFLRGSTTPNHYTFSVAKAGRKMSRNQYLKMQGNTWHVLVQVPARLRKAAGCWAYIKTLGTGDVNEANRLKHAYVAKFKRKIEALERGGPPPDDIVTISMSRRCR